MEANAASSDKDFRNKMYLCKKEVQETKHCLRTLFQCVSEYKKKEWRKLWKEAQELTLIFGKAVLIIDKRKKGRELRIKIYNFKIESKFKIQTLKFFRV